MLKKIRSGQQPSNKQEIKYAEELCTHGWLCKVNGHFSADFSLDADSREELIWLPNTLVTGTVNGEKSPVARLRASQDIWTLRLLVDLYHSHDLPGHGGIRRDVLYQKFTKQRLGESGSYAIWVFKPEKAYLYRRGPSQAHRTRPQRATGDAAAWDNIELSQDLGLMYCVPHLFESDSPDSSLIHGFSALYDDNCEAEERELGKAADRAGRHMAGRLRLPIPAGFRYCVPVWKTMRNVEMVGTYRSRYRPHTLLTSEWRAQLAEKSARYLKAYEAML